MASGNWKMVSPPAEFVAMWKQANGDEVPPPNAFQHPSGLTALVGREPYGHGDDDWRWHISVRYGDPGVNGRVPTWEELVNAAHSLRPGVCFVIGIPPRSWWMNVHPHVLHLIETRDEPLIQSYRDNAMAATPT
jgi:hypothetical protein